MDLVGRGDLGMSSGRGVWREGCLVRERCLGGGVT